MKSQPGTIADRWVITDVDQARLLTDPLKLRILYEFIEQPRTTKQVAELLDEKPTRLYRHVDQLMEAGFLRLIEERKKRGTVERYLRSVARSFEIDSALLQPNADDPTTGEPDMSWIFRDAESALRTASSEDEGTFAMRAHLRIPMTVASEVRQRMEALLGEYDREYAEPCSEWVMLVAMHRPSANKVEESS